MRRWLVERTARALFAYRCVQFSFYKEDRDWTRLSESRRCRYRVEAEAILRHVIRGK